MASLSASVMIPRARAVSPAYLSNMDFFFDNMAFFLFPESHMESFLAHSCSASFISFIMMS
jgi:hypothetical protein